MSRPVTPGLSKNLEDKHPGYSALMSKIIRSHNDRAYRPWTRYMVRCSGCARWQELRNFRTRYTRHNNPHMRRHNGIPLSLPDSSRCNQCFALANGVQELGRVLLIWFDFWLHGHHYWLAEELEKAWKLYGPILCGFKYEMPRKYRW